MNLPHLQPKDLPALLEENDIEVRDKDNCRWLHWPILAIASLIITLTGGNPENFSQGLMVFFWGGATFYPHDDLDAEDVRTGNVDVSDMPNIVHELTHCFQWIELGAIWGAICYVCYPLFAFWTGRSTLEFEATSNEILWLRFKYGYGDWLKDHAKHSAKVFTGSTYVWATTNIEGWEEAIMKVMHLSRIQKTITGKKAIETYSVHKKFRGYNPR